MTTRALDLLGQELAETEPLVSRKPSFSQRHPRLSLVVIVDRTRQAWGDAEEDDELIEEEASRGPSAKWQRSRRTMDWADNCVYCVHCIYCTLIEESIGCRGGRYWA